MEMLEYFLNILVIFEHVIQVDKYIIQINYDIDIQKIGENIVYESLEGYGNISKTKEYYRPLE